MRFWFKKLKQQCWDFFFWSWILQIDFPSLSWHKCKSGTFPVGHYWGGLFSVLASHIFFFSTKNLFDKIWSLFGSSIRDISKYHQVSPCILHSLVTAISEDHISTFLILLMTNDDELNILLELMINYTKHGTINQLNIDHW